MYCTPDQVKATLVRRPGVGGGPADVGDEVITSQIEAAQAEVDIALAPRFVVPFTDGHVPTIVEQVTVAIAAYLTTLAHLQSLSIGMKDDDPALRRYGWAVSALKALAKGQADLPAEHTTSGGTPEPAPPHGRSVSTINLVAPGLFSPGDFGLTSEVGDRHARPGRFW